MTDRVIIRPCRPDDLRPLEWDGLFSHHREIIERTYRDQLAGHQLMLVAEVDGALKAQAWVDLHSRRRRGAGLIWALRVHPAAQRCRLGTRLLDAAEETIRQHGLKASELAVETTNTRARRLYERHGYAATRTVPLTYSYTTPDGSYREHTLDLLELRKELVIDAATPGDPLDRRKRQRGRIRGAATVGVGCAPSVRRPRHVRHLPELGVRHEGSPDDG